MRQIDSSADPADHESKWNLGCGPGPNCRHADYFSGSVALAKERFEEAESFFSKEVDLSYPFPQLSLALLYFERGMLREAEAIWIRIPSISRYLVQLGEKLQFKERRLSEARILYELAVKYESGNQTAHYLLGTILLHNPSQRGDLQLSIEHSRRGLVGTGRDFWALYNMGLAHQRLSEYEAARKCYTEALTILPGAVLPTTKLRQIRVLDTQSN